MPEPWTPTPPIPPKPSTVSRPLIGMAVCACVFVVWVLTGLFSLCGGNFNSGQSSARALVWIAGILSVASFLGGVGCLVWFIVRLIADSRKR